MDYSKEATKEMKHAMMLYKVPGKTKGKGSLTYDYIVVDSCDEEKFNDALQDGWCRSIAQASGEEEVPVETPTAAMEKTQAEEAEAQAVAAAKQKEEEAPVEDDEDSSKKAVENARKKRGHK